MAVKNVSNLLPEKTGAKTYKFIYNIYAKICMPEQIKKIFSKCRCGKETMFVIDINKWDVPDEKSSYCISCESEQIFTVFRIEDLTDEEKQL